MSGSRSCLRSKGGSKIVKHKIATKIPINFVESKGGNEIIKLKIATKIEGSYQKIIILVYIYIVILEQWYFSRKRVDVVRKMGYFLEKNSVWLGKG